MNHEPSPPSLSLIEREDELLHQYDTCQQLMAALWQCAKEDSIHLRTARQILETLRVLERSIDHDLFDIRMAILQAERSRKSPPLH